MSRSLCHLDSIDEDRVIIKSSELRLRHNFSEMPIGPLVFDKKEPIKSISFFSIKPA